VVDSKIRVLLGHQFVICSEASVFLLKIGELLVDIGASAGLISMIHIGVGERVQGTVLAGWCGPGAGLRAIIDEAGWHWPHGVRPRYGPSPEVVHPRVGPIHSAHELAIDELVVDGSNKGLGGVW
jgi:hypothetical protein